MATGLHGARSALAPADPNEGYRQSHRIWSQLPDDRSWQCHEHMPWDDELLLAICEIAMPSAGIKDTSIASVLRRGLVDGGWLTAHPTDLRNVVEYRKVTTAPEPDARSFVEIENAHLDRAREQERALLAQDMRNREQVAEWHRQNNPERLAMAGHLHALAQEAGFVTRAEVTQIVEAAVEAALDQRQAVSSSDNG